MIDAILLSIPKTAHKHMHTQTRIQIAENTRDVQILIIFGFDFD